MILDDWQKQVLATKGDILLCTGRRVGKTYIMARKAIERMIKKKTTIVIVSLTEDQAMIIHFMALHYLEENYKKEISKKFKTTIKRITLTNGSVMISRPVGDTGDATRGYEGGVLIIDEASRMPKLFWIASKPILLTTNGEIWMCSTPFGKQGYFWEKFNETYNLKKEKARFKVFYESSEKVMYNRPLSETWTLEQREGAIRILEEEKGEMSDLEYGQEYLGLFLDELRQYFSDDLINKACILKERETIRKERDYSMGCDIARLGGDEGTWEILDYTNREAIEHIHHESRTKILTTETEDRIYELNRLYDLRKIYIDAGAGSLGVGIFDHLLRNPETKRKVVAINNKARSLDRDDKAKQKLLKEDLYDNLRFLIDRGYLKLLDNEEVKSSLRSIQYEYQNKERRESQIRIFGNYSHIAEGLTRAAWCEKEKVNKPWIDYI